MVGDRVCYWYRGDKHLIAPKHRQTAHTAPGVAAGLLDHRFQYRDGLLLVVNQHRSRQFDPRFVVVFRPWQRGQASTFARGMVQTNANFTSTQIRIDIHAMTIQC